MREPAGLPARGTCYGYEVRSELDLRYLRGGDGEALEIAVRPSPAPPRGAPLQEWGPPRFPTGVRLYSEDGAYRLWVEDAGWFSIDPRVPRLGVPDRGDPVRLEERIWGLPVLLCFMERGDLPLHGACVEIDGRALVMAGPRAFGKTTLAAAFASSGFRVLAEDLVCVRRDGGGASVIPGPAMLRVRRDVAPDLRIRGARELARDEDRVHYSLESERRTCDPVPLGGIALLNEADVAPRLERVEGADVVRDLWAVSLNLPTDEDRARCFEAVSELASGVRTWSLERRLLVGELPETVECLVAGMRGDRDGG